MRLSRARAEKNRTEEKRWTRESLFLLAAAIGLTPIALAYGLAPITTVPMFYEGYAAKHAIVPIASDWNAFTEAGHLSGSWIHLRRGRKVLRRRDLASFMPVFAHWAV